MEAFEGTKDMMKAIGEKAKVLGKSVAKEAKKVVGIHVGQVTEANPRYYLVVAAQGAMVREGIELDSPAIQGLRVGDIVTCVDVSGRRAKIIDPVEGWVSIRTETNQMILELTIAPDKETQVAQMERRFEKLKAQQCSTSPDSLYSPSSTPITDAGSDSQPAAPVNTIKTKLAFKTNVNNSTGGKGAIPKLSAPTGKRATATASQSSPVDLLELSSETHQVASLPNEPISYKSSSAQPTKPYQDPFADLLPPPTSTAGRSASTTIRASAQLKSEGPAAKGNDLDAWFG